MSLQQLLNTSRVVTGSQQDTTSCLHLPNDMTRGRCAENAILPDNEFLDSVSNPDPCDQLHHFWIVITPVSTNHKECALGTFWD